MASLFGPYFRDAILRIATRSLLFCCIGLVGCSVTELSIDVVTDGQTVRLYFREVERPDCTCNNGNFPTLGECVGINDGIVCTCEPGPARCLSQVSALRNGEVVKTRVIDPDWPIWYGYVGLSADVEVDQVLIEGCGTVAEVALDYEYSTPEITSIAAVPDRDLRVEWTTTPSAPFEIVTWGGMSAVSCLGENNGAETLRWDSLVFNWGSVRTVELDEQVTSLGVARVWYGNEDTFEWECTDCD